MKDIWLILGTRPEAIKMCPLLPALRARGFVPHLAVSGQHRELLDEALSAFSATPEVDMALMRPGQAPPDLLAHALSACHTLLQERPADLVLVHGDTVTAYAAALACFFAGRPLGHVEAGLRTHDLRAPFPEEFCRRAITPLATLHFAPTEAACANLLREGIDREQITVTGNTAIDALRMTQEVDFQHPALEQAGGRRLVLLTVHRRESQGEAMRAIFRAVRRLADRLPHVFFYCPLHPNPAVQEAGVLLRGHRGILLDRPQEPRIFHNLLSRCYLVMTDSGGLQEEAPYFHKPVLVLREKTERTEGVQAGVLRLCGVKEEAVYQAAHTLLTDDGAYHAMQKEGCPFGDGQASRRIAHAIWQWAEKKKKS